MIKSWASVLNWRPRNSFSRQWASVPIGRQPEMSLTTRTHMVQLHLALTAFRRDSTLPRTISPDNDTVKNIPAWKRSPTMQSMFICSATDKQKFIFHISESGMSGTFRKLAWNSDLIQLCRIQIWQTGVVFHSSAQFGSSAVHISMFISKPLLHSRTMFQKLFATAPQMIHGGLVVSQLCSVLVVWLLAVTVKTKKLLFCTVFSVTVFTPTFTSCLNDILR